MLNIVRFTFKYLEESELSLKKINWKLLNLFCNVVVQTRYISMPKITKSMCKYFEENQPFKAHESSLKNYKIEPIPQMDSTRY